MAFARFINPRHSPVAATQATKYTKGDFMRYALLLVLSMSACFHDTGPLYSDSSSTFSGEVSGGSDATGTIDTFPGSESTTSSEEDTSHTFSFTESVQSSDSDTAESSSTSSPGSTSSSTESTSGDLTTTGTTTSDGTTTDPCASPLEVPVPDPFATGESRTFDLDFDEAPGETGGDIKVCATFTTTAPPSARTITFDEQVLGLGPCNAQWPPEDPFTGCTTFPKPDGVTPVTVDNVTPGPGCQSGPMADLVITFSCPEGI